MMLLKQSSGRVLLQASQNDEIDTDMHFCESLVSSVKALSPEKNSLAQVKTQKVLFEIEFGENLD